MDRLVSIWKGGRTSGGLGCGISVEGILDVAGGGVQATMSALAAAPMKNLPFILSRNEMNTFE